MLDHMEQPGLTSYRGLASPAGEARAMKGGPAMHGYGMDTIWVGLDVHKSSVTAAVLHGGS